MKKLWMALMVIFCSTASVFASVEIELQRAAVIESEYLKLSDIATISGDNAGKVSKVFLGPAPRKGTSMTILRSDIIERLKGMGMAQDLAFTGSLGVNVSRGGEEIAKVDTIKASFDNIREEPKQQEAVNNREQRSSENEDYLAKARNAAALDYIRSAIKEYVSEKVEAGVPVVMQTTVNRFNIDGDSGSKASVEGIERGKLPGRATLAVVFTNEHLQVTGYASVDVTIKMEVDVPVLAMSMGKGDMVRPQDIVQQRVAYKPGMAVEQINPDAIAGRVTLKPIRAGVPLSAAFFGEPLDIQKGQMITVCIVGNGFSIKEMALALANGNTGDTINVESVVSKSVYPVRVTGRNKADMPISSM